MFKQIALMAAFLVLVGFASAGVPTYVSEFTAGTAGPNAINGAFTIADDYGQAVASNGTLHLWVSRETGDTVLNAVMQVNCTDFRMGHNFIDPQDRLMYFIPRQILADGSLPKELRCVVYMQFILPNGTVLSADTPLHID